MTREVVERLLAAVTPFDAALLRARYHGGLSFDQIAAVRQAHHWLLRRLRDGLGE